jgi:hypothetical protein
MTGSSTHFSRRRALKAFGVTALGAVGVAGSEFSVTSASAQDGNAPAVEWQQSYEGGETEYTSLDLWDLLQTEDGGYALMGDGQPIAQTDPEPQQQFALVKTDSGGEQQWIAFAGDGNEETAIEPDGPNGFQTEDGGYVLVGSLGWVDQDAHVTEDGEFSTEGRPSGAAAKFGPGGEVEWFCTIDAGIDEPHQEGDLYAVAESSTSGEFVAAGRWLEDEEGTSSPWLVKFDANGLVEWERTYDSIEGLGPFFHAFAREGGGYTLVNYASSPEESNRFRVVRVDETGTVEDSAAIDLGVSTDHSTSDVVPTSDGGFAIAGQERGQENWRMWLAKLDADLDVQWSKTYDGPHEGGKDNTRAVVQTEDGGYALGSYLEAAFTGEATPVTVVKTDAEGNQQWEKQVDAESSFLTGLVQTADSGYAMTLPKGLIKLGYGVDGDGDGGDGGGDDGDGGGDGDDGDDPEKPAQVGFTGQDSDGTSVVVQQATLPEGGYLVVHASDDGTPGAVLGHSAYLSAGDHSNVEVALDEPISSTQTLIAMAHTDDGDQECEFPDADGPYTADGEPVTDDASVTLVC